jgi:hypothetical protein
LEEEEDVWRKRAREVKRERKRERASQAKAVEERGDMTPK